MHRLPRVSIMIPTYKQDKIVSRAISSSLKQDYTNLEIIISDDCSPDNTKEIVKRFLKDKRVKYFRNDTNLGRVSNYRKTLFDYATGDWAINLDGGRLFC